MSHLTTLLAQLESAQLVRRLSEEELAYLFRHALTQEAAYESLMLKTRREIHRRVAQAYEQLYTGQLDEYAGLLAHHYAAAGDDAKTAEYAIHAGDSANRANAQSEARLYYVQALDALARLPDDDQNRRRRMDTLINQVWVSVFADAPAVNLTRLDEAELLAQQFSVSDPVVQQQLGRIYHLKGFMHQQQNRPREAIRYYNEERALAKALGDEYLLAQGTFGVGLIRYLQGRFAESEPLVRESIERMRKANIPLDQFSTFSVLGEILAAQANYAAGLANANHGLALAHQSNLPSAIEIGYTVLAEIYFMGRDIPRMLDASRACLEAAESFHDIIWVHSSHVYLAWSQSRLGQHAEARESLRRARAIDEMLKGQVPRHEWLAAIEADSLFNIHHFAEAQAVAEQVVAEARSVDSLIAEGVAQRVWAQALMAQDATRWAESEAHLSESLRLFEAGSAKLEAAHTHVAWGSVLMQRGESEQARVHFEKAAAQLEASGLRRELEETSGALAELGI